MLEGTQMHEVTERVFVFLDLYQLNFPFKILYFFLDLYQLKEAGSLLTMQGKQRD